MKVRRSFSKAGWGLGIARFLSIPEQFAGKHLLAVGTGLLGLTFLIGYLFAALFVFPAPFIVRNKSVPRVIGMDTSSANAMLNSAGFSPRTVESVTHPSAARGTVVWQEPPFAVVAAEGSEIELTISTGPQRVPLPDVTGYNLEMATIMIESAGLTLRRVERAQTTAPRGVAVNTRPAAGSFLVPGTGITLVVSDGAPTIVVPDVRGIAPDSARVVLEDAGLQLGVKTPRPLPTEAEGLVYAQDPNAGTLASPGTEVDVVIPREGR